MLDSLKIIFLKFCSKCGAENIDSAKFCTKCRYQFNSAENENTKSSQGRLNKYKSSTTKIIPIMLTPRRF